MKKPGPRVMSPEKIQSLISVALGKEKADLVVSNGSLVNVYTGEIQPNYCVAIKGDRIAYVGKDVNHTIGPDTRVIDAAGKTIIPGLIDAHTHMLSIINPVEYIKFAMLMPFMNSILPIWSSMKLFKRFSLSFLLSGFGFIAILSLLC